MNAPAPLDLSIIVPAYNEEFRLPASLERMAEYLAGCTGFYELIVVDDGSQDGTRRVVEEFARAHSWARLAAYNTPATDGTPATPLNKGKGFAVRYGMLRATGQYALFSDADLSTPIEELEALMAPLRSGEADVAIASRGLPQSRLSVRQPWYRERMGRAFNSVVRYAIGTSIADTQCGFKLFRGDAARRIFGAARVDGFGFDTELLYLAAKWGYRVAEIPVTWEHRDDSRVNPLTAPLGMMRDVIGVRLNDLRGVYGSARKASEPRA